MRITNGTPDNPACRASPGCGGRAGYGKRIAMGVTIMESDLFEWSAWDVVSDTILQFYGCVLKVPIGRFKTGDTVPVIVVDFETGVLQLYDSQRAGHLLAEHKVRMVLAD
jgi:hypothetical protein